MLRRRLSLPAGRALGLEAGGSTWGQRVELVWRRPKGSESWGEWVPSC